MAWNGMTWHGGRVVVNSTVDRFPLGQKPELRGRRFGTDMGSIKPAWVAAIHTFSERRGLFSATKKMGTKGHKDTHITSSLLRGDPVKTLSVPPFCGVPEKERLLY